MVIKRFEDILAWQKSKELSISIYKLFKDSKDYAFKDQIQRASISVMNNISEGFDAKSNNEFIRFLTYSRRSCSEVQNCLYIALDQGCILAEEFSTTYDLCKKIRKIIDGLIRYLRNHKMMKS